MGNYDILWKGMIEDVFVDLVRFVFGPAKEDLDLERGVQFLDKELADLNPEPGRPIENKFVDKLAKIYRKDGGELWLLLHLEIQGWNDPNFAERMFVYYYRIRDRFRKMPISAVAVFTGRDGRGMPDKFEDSCLGTHLAYQYNTVYAVDYSNAELMSSDNLFAMTLLVAKLDVIKKIRDPVKFDEALLEQKTLLFKYFEDRKLLNEEKISRIQIFLNNYMSFENSEINNTFMERIDQISGKKNTMGVLEQLAEIRADERAEKVNRRIVENLINNTEFSSDRIAFLVGVTVEFVESIRKELQSR